VPAIVRRDVRQPTRSSLIGCGHPGRFAAAPMLHRRPRGTVGRRARSKCAAPRGPFAMVRVHRSCSWSRNRRRRSPDRKRSAPDAADERLIQQPAIQHDVHGSVRSLDLHHAQRVRSRIIRTAWKTSPRSASGNARSAFEPPAHWLPRRAKHHLHDLIRFDLELRLQCAGRDRGRRRPVWTAVETRQSGRPLERAMRPETRVGHRSRRFACRTDPQRQRIGRRRTPGLRANSARSRCRLPS